MCSVFTHESICPECPFKSNQRKREIFEFDSAVCSAVWHIDSAVHGMHTTESKLAHRGDWLSGVMDTAQIDSAEWWTPRRLTLRWDALRRVFLLLNWSTWLRFGMHTVEIVSAVGCTPRRLTNDYAVWCILRGLINGVIHPMEIDSAPVVWWTWGLT